VAGRNRRVRWLTSSISPIFPAQPFTRFATDTMEPQRTRRNTTTNDQSSFPMIILASTRQCCKQRKHTSQSHSDKRPAPPAAAPPPPSVRAPRDPDHLPPRRVCVPAVLRRASALHRDTGASAAASCTAVPATPGARPHLRLDERAAGRDGDEIQMGAPEKSNLTCTYYAHRCNADSLRATHAACSWRRGQAFPSQDYFDSAERQPALVVCLDCLGTPSPFACSFLWRRAGSSLLYAPPPPPPHHRSRPPGRRRL